MQAIGGIYNGSAGASCPSPNGRRGRTGHAAARSWTQGPAEPYAPSRGFRKLTAWSRRSPRVCAA